jgi:hypothetical protein
VVRQSKRDARLMNMIAFVLYIDEHDKWVRSHAWRMHSMAPP